MGREGEEMGGRGKRDEEVGRKKNWVTFRIGLSHIIIYVCSSGCSR